MNTFDFFKRKPMPDLNKSTEELFDASGAKPSVRENALEAFIASGAEPLAALNGLLRLASHAGMTNAPQDWFSAQDCGVAR